MIHKVTTPPSIEPVTVEEMREFIGIGDAADISRDAILQARLQVARELVEEITGYHVMTQTVTAYACGFPCREIQLEWPLQSVSSVSYLDNDGIRQTLSPSLYSVDLINNQVVPIYGTTWPSHRQDNNSLQVVYVAGHTAVAEVPERIKEAVKFIVNQWERFQNSQDGLGYPPDVPNVVKTLLRPYTYRVLF